MTKTKKLSLALSALGWQPDPNHPARATLKGGRIPGFPATATWRIFPDRTGGARLSPTGRKADSRALSDALIARILAAADQTNTAANF